ncbi:DUF3558 domain-containing protein [Actinomycetospora sp. DW7H6]|uniref:DUF3558 domain-containing protein n=2 Tax=Actinomycetospora lemnae TaxID=3019891 RepID=A0ABT5T041_9PSEU|nr:DUF3558 domain-containing protein [Actinomycetospora sp. DW7H6]MDD7968488.1 DUF3558 domain-containing protein [Actinomycetospora sp. DW7H6]
MPPTAAGSAFVSRRLVLALVILTALCACSTAPTVPPPPTDGRFGAPLPTSSRDLRRAAEDPCENMLTDQQVIALGLAPTTARIVDLPGTRQCSWSDEEQRQTLSLAPWAERDLLVDTYRTRQLAVFRPDEIAGAPVVYQQSAPSAPACTITAGAAQGQAFETTWYSLGRAAGSTPCESARRTVETVLSNLPPAPQK